MGRVNKTIEGVFIDIVGSSSELSSYDQFINHGDGKKYSKELEELTALYKKEVTKSKVMFEKLASLEEIIIQMRIREDLSDIKLTQVREYIYARTPFYRKDFNGHKDQLFLRHHKFTDFSTSPRLLSL